MSKECKRMPCGPGGGGTVYGIGLIGAIVYYVQQASSFGEGAVGVLKAFAWPALLVHKVLTIWGM